MPAIMEEPVPEVQNPEPEIAATTAPASNDPGPAGFLPEAPIPAAAQARSFPPAAADFSRHFHPALPGYGRIFPEMQLVAAGQMAMELAGAAQVGGAPCAPCRLDLREFGRNASAPAVDFLLPACKTGELTILEEPMDLLIFPQPPPGSPPLWQDEAVQEFGIATDLGVFGRVAFRTTGVQDNEDGEISLALLIEEPPPATPVIQPEVKPEAKAASLQAEPVPQAIPELKLEPKPEPKPEPKSEPVPERATKPLPVTLHALAAGRGKPVHVFPSVVSGDLEIQAPRSNALPLRPVMILEPAANLEEKKPLIVRTEPKKPQPSRPEQRFSNGKGRKPETRVFEPERKEPAKQEAEKKTFSPAAPAAIAVKAPPAESKSPVLSITAFPEAKEPLGMEYAPALSLPSLTMGSPSFWSKLPVAGKAGIGVGVLLAVAGMIFLVTKGGGGTVASTSPQVVAGEPLPAVTSGWITDWGAEPGVRREHDISVLRPSMNLTDYRMEFQAQIEEKALGWIYRAQDPKNYYVNKLEIVKPGLEPTIALIRFAVINGEEQPRAQFPLSIPVRIDTLYKIRFDAVGDRFTTYVQDQKVDQWTDDRVKTGGVGLYNERDERMSLKGSVDVVPLVVKR